MDELVGVSFSFNPNFSFVYLTLVLKLINAYKNRKSQTLVRIILLTSTLLIKVILV